MPVLTIFYRKQVSTRKSSQRGFLASAGGRKGVGCRARSQTRAIRRYSMTWGANGGHYWISEQAPRKE